MARPGVAFQKGLLALFLGVLMLLALLARSWSYSQAVPGVVPARRLLVLYP